MRHRDRKKLFVALVDVYKAYDTVPVDPMCARAERIGLPLFARHLRTLYQHIALTVMTPYGYTEPFQQLQGLFQGLARPLAYVIFINPCMACLRN